MSVSPQTLDCSECKFANELERVYCHNCGAKLDRSVLPRDDDEDSLDAKEKARKRVHRMTNPGRKFILREVKIGAKVIGGALALSFLFQAGREPEGLPPAKGEPSIHMVGSEIAEALESKGARQLIFTESDLNSHLRSSVKMKPGTGSVPGVDFTRAYAQLEPKVCTVGIEQSLWGFPFYISGSYNLEVKDGEFRATLVGGHLGRVLLPVPVMELLDIVFQRTWTSLKRDHEGMKKMQMIVIEKERIMFVTKGT